MPAIAGLIAQLAAAPDEPARLALLQASRPLLEVALVQRIHDEVVRVALADVDRAERLAAAANWIAETLDDDYCRALSRRAFAHLLYARSQYAPALQQYQEALGILEKLGRDADAARTRSSALQTLIYLGLYEEAFAWADRAREVFTRLGDELRLARLDSNVGNILFRQDRYGDALRLYQRARAAFEQVGEPRDLAAVLSNMAVCSTSLGEFDEALDHYREARACAERNAMPLLVAEADYNVAYLHYLRGEYMTAIRLYQATREHCARAGDAYHAALCDLDQSEIYLELNLSLEAGELARKAFRSFEQLGMGYEKAKALTNLALSHSHLGRSRAALRLLRQARRLFAAERNQVWPALIDLYRALVLYGEKRLSQARRLCLKALAFFSRTPLSARTVLCELLLGRLLLDSGELAAARNMCATALCRLEPSEAPSVAFYLHLLFAQIEEALGNREAAGSEYRLASLILETLRSRLAGEEIKIAFLKDKVTVYENLVAMCLEGEPAPEQCQTAFSYMESAKSRSLADLIAFHAHALPARPSIGGELAGQVRNLRKDLNWYYHQIDLAALRTEKTCVKHIETLRRRARLCEDNLVRLLADARAADQEFAALQGAGPVSLERIRQAIPDDATVLEYYEARGLIYACLLTRERLNIVPLGPAAQALHLLRLLQFQLAKFRLGAGYVDTFGAALRSAAEAHLAELYAELVQPLERRLETPHLVVVPHGFLHYVPFHALRGSDGFLADRHTISYAPSASVYALCAAKQPTHARQSLVLGVPDALTPHILEEAHAAAAALPQAQLYLGTEATEELLRSHGRSSRFIHIATHGAFRRDNPMLSSIRLGDSYLTLLDLYQLQLDAELVTLSGCSTGLSALVGGDELVGLVRGLLFSGAQGVLVSLWDVNDRSTADFMAAFYRNLRATPDKAVALRAAMRDLRDAHPHPYYWAPFILVGKYLTH